MALDYSTEFELIFPRELYNDPEIGDLFDDIGFPAPDAKGNKIMLFRDPGTVAALLAQPKNIQGGVLQSGYGLKPYENPTRATGKLEFLSGNLRALVTQVESGETDAQAARSSVYVLHKFVLDVATGARRTQDGYPIVEDPAMAAILRQPPAEPFDIARFMARSIEQLTQEIAAEKQATSARASCLAYSTGEPTTGMDQIMSIRPAGQSRSLPSRNEPSGIQAAWSR